MTPTPVVDVAKPYRVAVTVEVVVTSRAIDVLATAETQIRDALSDQKAVTVASARLLGPAQ